ncbi:MAG: hypothetical protein LH475_01475 [Cryobacterium sp.]|uniref:DUF6704 family protein n=1 Tax=unclassified Cryobacterium TaxID=2649013 RepID=UPI0018CB8EA0|nr:MULTISPECIES: DUF6704 family protein [unclassified Cryobacterium]MCY7403299.1 hypothetical protein [Cryobacterium sp.]MEC5155502.1 hypothetical protein [Cryobacterium sp. CAN_C3]
MSIDLSDPGHGHSAAAWTAVIIMLAAFAIGTTAFFFELVWLVWVSLGLLIAGVLVGYVLSKVGYGVSASPAMSHGH